MRLKLALPVTSLTLLSWAPIVLAGPNDTPIVGSFFCDTLWTYSTPDGGEYYRRWLDGYIAYVEVRGLSSSSVPANFNLSTMARQVDDAASVWRDPAYGDPRCPDLRGTTASLCCNLPFVEWRTDSEYRELPDFDDPEIARARPFYFRNGVVAGFDIYFRNHPEWIWLQDCPRDCTFPLRIDFPTVLIHELGHTLELGHAHIGPGINVCENALMWHKYPDKKQRETIEEERVGVVHLYNMQPAPGEARATLFTDYGAFLTTAFCETFAENGSETIYLYGYLLESHYPENPTLLDSVFADGAYGSFRRYQMPLPVGFALYEWVEVDSLGESERTGPFEVTSKPGGWDEKYGVQIVNYDEEFPPDSVTGVPPSGSEGETPAGVNTGTECELCADILVYGTADTLIDPVYAQIVADNPTKMVRRATGDTRSASDAASAIWRVWAENIYNNDVCEQYPEDCTRTYPEAPGPEVYLVGHAKDYTGGVNTASFPDTAGYCDHTACRSDYLLYDFDGDGLPEGPISRVPATWVSHAQTAANLAAEYSAGLFTDPLRRVQVFADDVTDPAADHAIERIESEFQKGGFLLNTTLRSSAIPAHTDRREALDSAVTSGVAEIFGYGGHTSGSIWPGRFIEGVSVDISDTKQRIIAWVPGCLTNTPQSSSPIASGLMLHPDPEHTAFAGCVGMMDVGTEVRHHEMAEYFAEARAQAALNSEPVSLARAAYDAVIAASTERPWLRDHALMTSVWGSFVRLDPTSGTCVSQVSLPDDSLVVCPKGDGPDSLVIEATIACGFDVSDSSTSVVLVKNPLSSPGLQVWDAVEKETASLGDTLRSVSYDPSTRRATFVASAISGCGTLVFDLYVNDVQAASNISLEVRSLDLDPLVVGAVDHHDSTAFFSQFFDQSQSLCGDFDWNGDVSTNDWLNFWNNHRDPASPHAVERELYDPDGGEQFFPNESVGVSWKRGYGDSSRVRVYLVRDSDTGYRKLLDPLDVWSVRASLADSGSNGVGQGAVRLPPDSEVPPGTDYRFEIVHTAGVWDDGSPDFGRDTSDATIEILDPGCPFVETLTANGWKGENSVLGRSADGSFKADAYKLKHSAATVNGRYRIRAYENSDEFTTLEHAGLAALDLAGDAEPMHVSNRFVIGSWQPAISAFATGGVDVTHLVDGSTSEHFKGEPGDTLVVELPPLATRTSDGSFSTQQGGGGSGGSGGGKEIPFAADPPPEFGTEGTLDERILEQTGIIIQIPDGSGGWQTAKHYYPREYFDDFVIDGHISGPMRLIFKGKHKINYLGRVTYVQDPVVPTPLKLLAAEHSRLGDKLETVDKTDGSTTIIAPGDTLTLEFEAPPVPDGKRRELFLVTNGVYSSTAPQGFEEIGDEPKPTYHFALGPAVPNPTTGSVRFSYTLARDTNVSIRVYNVAGRLVRTLASGNGQPGPHELVWDARDDGGRRVGAGVYFYKMVAGDWRSQQKVVFLNR